MVRERPPTNPFKEIKTVPESELEIEFVRSSGPGGQNVNKTSTKAQLHWNIEQSSAFNDDEKQLIAAHLASRINKKGEVVLASDQERSQLQNKNIVIDQLRDLVAQALIPATERVATKPTRSSRVRRLDAKTLHSRKKAGRGKSGLGEHE